MQLNLEFQPIRDWARERNLIIGGNPITQLAKLTEEMGELAQGLLKDNQDEVQDAIGDCVVVLTNLAAQRGLLIEDCINSAYNEIKNRKGKMVNGTFKKD